MLKISWLYNFVLIAACFSSNLFAQTEGSTEASEDVSIVALIGSAVAVSAIIVAGEWIITNIKQAQNKVSVTMRSPTQHKNTTIIFPATQLKETPLAKGQKVQVKTVQTGYLFQTQGKTLGFLPNQQGKPLLHSASYD